MAQWNQNCLWTRTGLIMVNTIPPAGTRAAAPSLLKPLDPEKAKKFEETKRALQQALDATKNAPNEMNKQRKAMAAQKVARIKEQLKALKQMGAAADPKMVARMAAQLARDLAQALKEYAAAGATTTEVQSTGGATPAPSAAPAKDQPAEAASDMPAEAAAVPTTDPATTEAEAVQDKGSKAYSQAQNLGNKQENSDEPKTVQQKDDDRPFLEEARKVLEELKNLIKLQRLRHGPKEFMKRDEVSDAEKALKAAEAAFQTLGRSVAATTISA